MKSASVFDQSSGKISESKNKISHLIESLKKGRTRNCIHCQGKMLRGVTPFHVDRKGCHLMLEAIPDRVCEQCGESYFEEGEVDAIQDLALSLETKVGALAAIK